MEMWNHFDNQERPRNVVGMLIITKKKVVREGVAQQNISSSDQSDESEDDAGTSDASDTSAIA